MMIPIKEKAGRVVFLVQVLPRSSQCKLVGCQGDFLKIKITAPPVDGRANEECIRFLADVLGVKKDQVQIVSGLKAKKKIIAIQGLTMKAVEDVLAACLPAV
jgi:uncharacterized protein (TIGR00251 family)